jgi:hypothetical protein
MLGMTKTATQNPCREDSISPPALEQIKADLGLLNEQVGMILGSVKDFLNRCGGPVCVPEEATQDACVPIDPSLFPQIGDRLTHLKNQINELGERTALLQKIA